MLNVSGPVAAWELVGVVILGLSALLALVLYWQARRARPARSAGGRFSAAVPVQVRDAQAYQPENVGNDASARPFEQAVMDGQLAPASAVAELPAGFDAAVFLVQARTNFLTLQAAWDRHDVAALRALMTPAMCEEIAVQLAARAVDSAQAAEAATPTDLVMLDARLVGLNVAAPEWLASVEFSGMVRDEPSAGPSPFRELWSLSRARDGGAWLVAGVQALQ